MKNIKINIVITVISIFFLVATVVLMSLIVKSYKLNEDSTTAFTATVSDVVITDTGTIDIYTKEHKSYLLITTNISNNIEIDNIASLKNGQQIFFRVENAQAELMDQENVAFVSIASLSTDTDNLFSLTEYNEYMRISSYPPRIIGGMVIVVSSTVLLIEFCLLIIRRRTKSPNQGDTSARRRNITRCFVCPEKLFKDIIKKKINIKRGISALIDFHISCILSSVVVFVVTLGKIEVFYISLTTYFISFFLFLMFKDILFKGASIGKRILRIKVEKTDGSKFTVSDAFKRTLTLILAPMEVPLLVGQNQRIGDIWAKTTVTENRPQ